ncbi:MAG: hypothetical protein CMQ88_02210 [Gammaproteobacteria bacterium]|nr:hypothetical protein [Gammaproteobacteria bacterium]|tara:strand:+ start:253 stop:432 length:180 start_codon:yes stop_codon:yes gene_type:complete
MIKAIIFMTIGAVGAYLYLNGGHEGIADMFRNWIHSFADWLADITEKELTISDIKELTK